MPGRGRRCSFRHLPSARQAGPQNAHPSHRKRPDVRRLGRPSQRHSLSKPTPRVLPGGNCCGGRVRDLPNVPLVHIPSGTGSPVFPAGNSPVWKINPAPSMAWPWHRRPGNRCPGASRRTGACGFRGRDHQLFMAECFEQTTAALISGSFQMDREIRRRGGIEILRPLRGSHRIDVPHGLHLVVLPIIRVSVQTGAYEYGRIRQSLCR